MDKIASVDYRPFYRTSKETLWDRAFAMRDNCYRAIVEEFAASSIRALVVKSENGQYPPYIRIEAWKPVAGGARNAADSRIRSDMELLFKAMPYHEYTITTTARATIAGRSIRIADRPYFASFDAVQWALYTVGAGDKPDNYRPFSDFIVNVLVSMIPFARSRHSNRIERDFRNFLPFSLSLLSGFAGLVLGAMGFIELENAYHPEEFRAAFLQFILAVGFIIGALFLHFGAKVIVSVIDRPAIPPRYLLMLDSWHAAIPDLGSQADALKDEIAAKLNMLTPSGILTEVERYGFRNPNGFDERDRIVVSKGQGVAHIHVYSFGNDLFIGWDSYVNWATWAETRAISTRCIGMSRTEYRGLQAGIYMPNQFDLIDLNALAELVHRDVVSIVKSAMEEHKIDQEIDFTIIRGDREHVLDREAYDRRTKQQGKKASQRRWSVS